jgi:hypothetical protein
VILSGSFIVYSKKILLFKDFLSLEILGKKKLDALSARFFLLQAGMPQKKHSLILINT